MPDRNAAAVLQPHIIRQELAYDQAKLAAEVAAELPTLNTDQRVVYEAITAAISNEVSGSKVFFMDGLGGTGKTYVYNLLLKSVRSSGGVALAVASSGMAAVLLEGGQTAHRLFQIPIPIADAKYCSTNSRSPKADLLRLAKFFVWDEAPMADKRNIEAVDRTLRDLTKVNKPFGGKVFLFGGDFRQILPVVIKGSRAAIVNASLKKSNLWPSMRKLKLHINMRAQMMGSGPDAQEQQSWANYLKEIGEGTCATVSIDGVEHVEVPADLAMPTGNIDDLIQHVYRELPQRWMEQTYLKGRAILTGTNNVVDAVNEKVMAMLPQPSKEYLSVDCVKETHDAFEWPTEFLNNLNFSGMPPHKLILKPGAPIMLLRNMSK